MAILNRLLTTKKCPVYLRVFWIRKAFINLGKNVKTAVESCYSSVTTRNVSISKRVLPVADKHVLSTSRKAPLSMNIRATVTVGT